MSHEYRRIEAGANTAICQQWEESEIDWGVRPDGFSLHLSYEGLYKFIQGYWDGIPSKTQDEYSRPCGEPYEIGVADMVVEEIKIAGDGLRLYSYNTRTPEGGGVWHTKYFD